MPQPRILDFGPDPESTYEKTQKFFDSINDKYRERDERVKLEQTYKKYLDNIQDEKAFAQAKLEIDNSTLSPTKRLQAQETLSEVQKDILSQRKQITDNFHQLETKRIEREKIAGKKLEEEAKAKKELDEKNRKQQEVYQTYIDANLPPEEAKRRSQFDSIETARNYLKDRTKTSDFDKTIEKEAGKEYSKLSSQEIPKVKDAIANLDRVEELSKKLKGVTGYFKAALGSTEATEMQNLSAAGLEPIIKLFNPVGALPTQKLNWVRSQFSISPYDTQRTIQGKINAQKLIANQALERAKKRVAVLTQYKGNVPPEVITAFDKETGDEIDKIEKQVENKEEAPKEQKPKEENKKVRVRNKENGKVGIVTPYQGMEKKYELL